ncbi:MAG: hypothetical protein RI885_2663 [Actinomycetota bacterium]
MRVTLRDIAAEAGVSLQTVSNVVRGRTSRVSEATTERVLRLVSERGYVPNASARTLAASTSRTIGLFVPAREQTEQLLSPYDVAVLGGLERELRMRGYDLLLRGVGGLGEVTGLVQTWSLAGAVLLEFPEALLEKVEPIGDAVIVSLDAYIRNPAVLSVRSDDRAGGRLAAARLLAAGHRTVAFLGDVGADRDDAAAAGTMAVDSFSVLAERLSGFRTEALAGLATVEYVPARLSHGDGYALARWWLDHPGVPGVPGVPGASGLSGSSDRSHSGRPTAVFAAADILAIGFIQGLADAGVRVPADVSVIGYDDLAAGQYITPRLTTIAQDFTAKSAAVSALLFGETDAASPVITPVTLVERASVVALG